LLWSFARSLTFVPLGTIQRRRGMHERSGRGTLTRSRIIRAAADLFHQKGARATSPDEIIAASRTGKGQFYHYFRNKEGLVHEVLQTYLEAIKSGTSPIDYEISSWRDLERWFAAHLELQKRYQMTRGCPFGTLGNEVSADDELVRQDVSLIFEVVRNKLADFCLATIQGAMLMGKVQRSSQPVEAAAREAVVHVKSYLVKERPSSESRSTRSR